MESKKIYQLGKIMTVISGRLCSDGTAPSITEYEFYLKQIPNITMTLQCCVLSTGRYIFDQSFNLTNSNNNFYNIIQVNSGLLSVNLGGNTYSMGKNDLLFLSDSEQYRIKQYGSEKLDITVLRCSGILPEAYYELITSRILFGRQPGDAKMVNELVEMMYDYTGFGNDYGVALLSDTVSSLLVGIYSKCNRFLESNQVSDMPKWLSNIIEYSRNNLGNSISSKDMQRESGKTPSDFYRDFKNYTGVTPLKYLLSLRLEKSRSLLLTTNFQIKYISYVVGIKSVNHFIEYFKKEFGETPSEYRDRMKGISGQ